MDTKEMYKSLIDSSDAAISIIDANGSYLYANALAAQASGKSSDEIFGMRVPQLFSPEQAKTIMSDIMQVILKNEAMETESFIDSADQRRWYRTSMKPARNQAGFPYAVINYTTDITDLKLAHEALELSERRSSQIAEHSRTVIWEMDANGMYTYVNSMAEEVYGYTEADLVGKMHFYDLIPYDLRNEYQQRIFELYKRTSAGNMLDKPLLQKSGDLIWVSSSGTRIVDSSYKLLGYRGSDSDITQRKLAEEEFRKFRTISDQADYGTAISTLDGKLIYTNEAYARMHGWSIDELLGRNISILYSMKQFDRISLLLEKMKVTGRGFVAEEVWRLRRDGTVFPSLMSAKVIVDSQNRPQFMSATAMDITEIKHKETELQKLTIAIEQSPVAIVITDTNGNIQYASPAFERITGYSVNEILGENVRILKSGKTSQETYRDLWETIKSGQCWRGEWINKRKDGSFYFESISITPIHDTDGTISSYLAVKEDITNRKQAEQDRIAREAAEGANKAKSAFLSNMSHEIRTPLNAIIGFAQILKRDATLSPKQSEQVQTILRSGEHLIGLINDILDLSRIEAGQQVLKESDFCLHDLLDDLQLMFELRAKDKGLRLSIEKPGHMPRNITADQAKLRQVMINLMGNAVKFTANGSVTVQARMEQAQTSGVFKLLAIDVEDTGPGISQKDTQRIFESFWQTEDGQKAGGTGLGLAISRSLIEMMGGKLTVQSQPGKGSIFSFVIPVRECGKLERPAEKSILNVSGLKPGTGPIRILVADDRKDNRDMLRELLLPVGFDVREAVNGKEALDIFQEWEPHCVLMDMSMPVMDGYEATRHIKATARGKSIPVFAVTASAFDRDMDRVKEAGTDACLSKPFRAEELFALLSRIPGLAYTFDEPLADAKETAATGPISLDDMACLSPVLILGMREAVEQGDMAGLKALIEKVEEVDCHVAEKLMALAKQYDYEQLSELLKEEGE